MVLQRPVIGSLKTAPGWLLSSYLTRFTCAPQTVVCVESESRGGLTSFCRERPRQRRTQRRGESFPIFLSRNLEQTRAFLRQQTRGEGRCGLIGSSGATRLRAEGLEPSSTFHADYAWQHWYLADRADIRSSYQCEVFATEFEVQGLELDWIGVCWGGDFIWDGSAGWRLRALRYGSRCRWNELRNSEKRRFKSNAYRVLLTRARQGMVLFIPRGSAEDSTSH